MVRRDGVGGQKPSSNRGFAILSVTLNQKHKKLKLHIKKKNDLILLEPNSIRELIRLVIKINVIESRKLKAVSLLFTSIYYILVAHRHLKLRATNKNVQ